MKIRTIRNVTVECDKYNTKCDSWSVIHSVRNTRIKCDLYSSEYADEMGLLKRAIGSYSTEYEGGWT